MIASEADLSGYPGSGQLRKPVLCVDLDGTLVRTDTLWECALVALRRNPVAIFALLRALFRGKSHFKQAASDLGLANVAQLPYRSELLHYLNARREQGDKIVLATAANRSVADAVADHLGIFDEVIASSASKNLKGEAKRTALVERFGRHGYRYAGNDSADLPVWRDASAAIPVGAIPPSTTPIEVAFPSQRAGISTFLRGIRLHQWTKNLLVFVPLFTAGDFSNIAALMRLSLAAVALGLVASAQYLVNDLLDLEADRAHATKRHRPLASGVISIPAALCAASAMLAMGTALATALGPAAAALMGAYFTASVLYSAILKTKPLLDVFALAGLYVFRIVVGGVVAGHHATVWLLNFSFLFFLSLAFVKRFTELRRAAGRDSLPRRGYLLEDEGPIGAMGVASAFAATVVLSLYVYSQSAGIVYARPEALWGCVPLCLFISCRVWLLAWRGDLPDDPVAFVLSDPTSWATAGAGALVCAAARFGIGPW